MFARKPKSAPDNQSPDVLLQASRALQKQLEENKYPLQLQLDDGPPELVEIANIVNAALHPDEQEDVLQASADHMLDYSGNTPYDLNYRLLVRYS
ncbi:hypothetical protein [Paenibacillus donghaensis]|uniref:hypothetical protein n=1 Tax=Paenibacillus donghaensis TaxID=414771 RepID=UPI0012FD8402